MAICELCGEPMPLGEEMFKFHGYSGNCPKPPLRKAQPESTTYTVEKVTNDPQKYGLVKAECKRDDGIAGWVHITGPGIERLVTGDKVTITVTK